MDARSIQRYYTVNHAKYRSESIKQMVRARKESGRANEICDKISSEDITLILSISICGRQYSIVPKREDTTSSEGTTSVFSSSFFGRQY